LQPQSNFIHQQKSLSNHETDAVGRQKSKKSMIPLGVALQMRSSPWWVRMPAAPKSERRARKLPVQMRSPMKKRQEKE